MSGLLLLFRVPPNALVITYERPPTPSLPLLLNCLMDATRERRLSPEELRSVESVTSSRGVEGTTSNMGFLSMLGSALVPGCTGIITQSLHYRNLLILP